MELEKIRDSALIATLAVACPVLLKPFGFPVELSHQVGFAMVGAGSIGYVWLKDGTLTKKEKLQKIWEVNNVKAGEEYPTIIEENENHTVMYLPDGMSPEKIESTIPEMEYSLGKHIEIETKGKAVILSTYKKDLPKKVNYELQQYPKMTLPVQVGLSRKKIEVFDMAQDGHVYMLITGPQGMGKSTAVNGILGTLLNQENMTPDLLNLYLVDLKMGNELSYLADSPYTKMTCFDPDTQELGFMLEVLKTEVRDRMKKFTAAEKSTGKRVRDIATYNKLKDTEPLPYMLLIIDEYAELQQMEKHTEAKLMRLMMIGRAAGLRVILCTLRSVADVLNSNIKSLLLDRLVFAQIDKINSKVAMDTSGAEKLEKIAGRGLFMSGPELIEVQVPWFQG